MSDDSKTSIFRQESLERLSTPEQLDQLMQVVSPKSWIPLTTLGTLVGLALLWSLLGRIPMTAIGEGTLVYPDQTATDLVGLAYFSERSAGQIQPGMAVLVIPDSVDSGGILGRVRSVSQPQVQTLDKARQAAASPTKVDQVEVLIDLERDPTNPDRYRWSSASNTSLQPIPGTSTAVRITLAQKAPITFVFPMFEVAQP